MKKLRKILAIALTATAIIAMLVSVNTVTAFADMDDYDVDDSNYDDSEQKLFDYADLLTDSEEAALAENIVKYAKLTKLDIVIVTIDDNEGKESKLYADDFYDDNKFGYDYEYGSGVLLLVDMDDRNLVISTAGIANTFVDDKTEDILDSITSYFSDGKYAQGMDRFLKEVYEITMDAFDDYLYEDALEEWYENDYSNPNDMEIFYSQYGEIETTVFTYLRNPIISLVIALVIAGVAILIMNYSSKTKATITGRTYMDERGLNITERKDTFTHTTTTRRKINTDNGSGSHGGGGGGGFSTSSSGHSHGGGSRHF